MPAALARANEAAKPYSSVTMLCLSAQILDTYKSSQPTTSASNDNYFSSLRILRAGRLDCGVDISVDLGCKGECLDVAVGVDELGDFSEVGKRHTVLSEV